MKKIFNIDLTDEEFDNLMCEQAKGKELKVVNSKVIAVEHERTQEEINRSRESEIQKRLEELTKDFAQVEAGLVIDDIEERKSEFRTLLNEIRVLQGKQPRVIK